MQDYPDWCAGDGCADGLEYIGECIGDGKTLIWCEEGVSVAIDCDFFAEDSVCDWYEDEGYWDCM